MLNKDAHIVHQKLCTTMFTAALIINSLKWEKPKCLSIVEWINFGIHTM